jgi:hypothetical protein
MSLTNAQKSLLKQAQRAAFIGDDDYRATISAVTRLEDCTSSTDPRLMEQDLDTLLKWFEDFFWGEVDGGRLPAPRPKGHVFSVRGYWKRKNPKDGPNSRDRHAEGNLQSRCQWLESQLHKLGCDAHYLGKIYANTGGGWPYIKALERTLKSKQRAES